MITAPLVQPTNSTISPANQTVQLAPVVQPVYQSSAPTVQEQCKLLMDDKFKEEFKSVIDANSRWQKLNKILEVTSHVLQGSTTVLAFMAAAVKMPTLSIVAGCTGVCAAVCMSYSQNCKIHYKNTTKIIEKMTDQVKVANILPNVSDLMNNQRHILTAYNHSSISAPAISPVETSVAVTTPIIGLTPANTPSMHM